MNITSFASLHRSTLALAVAASICAAALTSASAATSGAGLITVAHATALRQGDAVVGALPMAHPIHIVVALKMQDRAGLDALIAKAAADQVSGRKPQLMTPAQFLATHAPTQAQAQKVASYLTSQGFRNVVIAPNRMLVSADGTANTAGNAFLTSFVQVHTKDGRTAFANREDAHIPLALQDSVLSVVGLQTVHQAHTYAHSTHPLHATPTPDAVGPPPNNSHNPNDFYSIYGLSTTSNGTNTGSAARGTSVGIVTDGDLTNTIATLNSAYGQHLAGGVVPGMEVDTSCTAPCGGDTSNELEWELDSQALAGITGQQNLSTTQIHGINFYNVPSLSNSDLLADYNEIITTPIKVVVIPIGECETDAQSDGSAAAQDAVFETAAAQGQTLVVGAGDSGADECGNGGSPTASWPAASEYVVAVGGTSLGASSTTWSSEVVWDDASNATGGSPSTIETMPSWQTSFGVPGSKRGVPDVAFDADPDDGASVITQSGSPATPNIGGTGLSASLFAGAWASVITATSNEFGFAGPVLYALDAKNSADFHDITSGNNGRGATGESAAVGYDFASGLGSLNFSTQLLTDIKTLGHKSPVANFTFTPDPTTPFEEDFADTSTPSPSQPTSAIVSWSWSFGDGATSTSQSPDHAYANTGTYKVIEKVTDQVGATGTKTEMINVVNNTARQLLLNTGFENSTTSPAPWTFTSSSGKTNPNQAVGLACNNASEPANTVNGGVCDMWLNGTGGANTSTLTQAVIIGSGPLTKATLQFYLHIDTAETQKSTAPPDDTLKVQVLNSAGTVLATLATYSDLTANQAPGTYTLETVDMTAYLGQSVKVRFLGTENASKQTSFVLDDVTLNQQ